MKVERIEKLKDLIDFLKYNPLNFTWCNDKTVVLESKISGYGRYATDFIKKDEIVVAVGGAIIDVNQYEQLKNYFPFKSGYKIDYGLILLQMNYDSKYNGTMNHACKPNVYIDGQVVFRAMRDIENGEELYVDYGTFVDKNDIIIDKCKCGFDECRGVITGKDWEKYNLIEKYKGQVAWYLLKKKLKY